jgi:hypothetical protein
MMCANTRILRVTQMAGERLPRDPGSPGRRRDFRCHTKGNQGVRVGYEVDFFPVLAGGAAIAVRWGAPGNYRLLVYDGGTAASGRRLVAHIEEHCLTSHVDYVVSSNPARQHSEGLGVVLEKLNVGELWMHRPWAQSERVWKKMGAAHRLEQLALAQGIPVHEPFAGALIGPFTVLSPRRQWYVDTLLPAFGTRLPRTAALTLADVARWVRLAGAGVGGRWDFEPLPRTAATSAEDESSAVLYSEFEGRGVLLTGNAGVRALEGACTFAERLGIDLPASLRLMQLPSQGRPDNLSSRVLDRIAGERQPREQRRYTKSAFISVGRDALSFDCKIVTDALRRRGVLSFATQGMQLHHAHDMPERGWHPAGPLGAGA